ADGHTPARRAGPDRRSRLQRPRRRRLRACAGLAAGAGRSVAETGGMNPAGGANDVIDYLDALLDDSQPVAAEAAVMATAQAAPAPDALPASAPVTAPEAAPEAAPAPAPATALVSAPVSAPQDMTALPPPVPPLAAAQPPAIAIAQAARWLRVLVGADSYALELLRVQEVVRVVPIVPMRGAAPAVL